MTTHKRLTDRKHEAILLAAISEFRQHGFSATSMDQLAASAGVSKRTVYNHFPSKEALFSEILRELWRRAAQVDLTYQADRPLREQLLELIWQKMHMLNDSCFLDLARALISEAILSPERGRDMMARLGDKEEGVTVWIRAALADSRLKLVDPMFAAQQLHGLVKGFAFWPQLTMGQAALSEAEQKQVVEATVDMFLGHYGLPE
ncbi:TetR/AcrR family transcriptional regulator [Pseudomonas anguilliseptica]|uniref:TetR/AcrR family transcriptional regulator n=1 Tax=Pseudomonas anguilliseptica TaxID=53406 RepID=UPI0037352531